MSYRFVRAYRGKLPGDPVPAEWDWGTVAALIGRGIVAESTEAKAISAPPEDKSFSTPRREKVRRK